LLEFGDAVRSDGWMSIEDFQLYVDGKIEEWVSRIGGTKTDSIENLCATELQYDLDFIDPIT